MANRSQGKTRAGGLWRWAGGKGRLLGQLFARLDRRKWRDGCAALQGGACVCGAGGPHLPPYNRWFVPFFGGGADAAEAMRRDMAREFVLGDACEDVVLAVKHWRAAEKFLLHALTLPVETQRELFYVLRAQRDAVRGFHLPDKLPVELDYEAWRAFRFLFLQATSFNGVWRVARSTGIYNVPFGRKGSVAWQALMEFELVASRRVHLWMPGDFEAAIDLAGAGDLVYADPPYLGTHDYGAFRLADHNRLAAALRRARLRGAECWVSGSDCEDTIRVYGMNGLDVLIHRLSSQRSVSQKSSTRGVTQELLLEIA